MATISQRISLEGGDDFKKQLEALGQAGEKSFQQIQAAAQKATVDPAKFTQTKQAIDGLVTTGTQLANQFLQLAQAAANFGSQGAQAAAQVTTGLQQTNAAAQQTAGALQQVGTAVANVGQSAGSGLISAATAFKVAAVALVAAIGALTSSLTKGAVESGQALSDQAEKLHLSIEAWLQLRQAVAGSTISNDDFQKSISKIAETANDAKGGIAKLRDGVTEQAVKVGDSIVTIIRMNDTLTDTTSKSSEAATYLRALGVSMQTIAKGDTLAIMQEMANAISKIPDAAARAKAGTEAFGANWQQTIKILLSGISATVEAGKSLDELGKAHRDMSADSVGLAVKLKAAWEDLSGAIGATKNLIGSLFLGSNLLKAEWLTKLVDGATELLRIFLGLDEVAKKGFLAGLGDTPAATLFKFLIDVGNQLAGIWSSVLVPAGKVLLGIIGDIASSFEDITSSQVAAFFITAAIAAVGLALAFKGIGLVLSPFSALLSLLVGFGPILIPIIALVVLFWDEIKQGAASAAALVPNSLLKIQQALAALFRGDFAGFWKLFSEGAVEAFQAISQEAQKIPWVKTLVDGVKTIGEQIPGTLKLIAEAFIALGNAATGAANLINKIFGTELTGTDIAAIVIIAQMTHGIEALAAATTIATATLGVLIAAVGGWAAAIILVIAGLLAWMATLREDAIKDKEAIIAAFVGMAQSVVDAFVSLGQTIAEAFNSVIDGVKSAIDGLAQWLVGIWDGFTGAAKTAIDMVVGLVDGLLQKLNAAWETIKNILGFGIGGNTGGGGSGFAAGGLLGGSGTGTSDSNLAWVSRGEYITPARAVAQPGVLAFLEALRRSGGNLTAVLDGMGRFALGGMVHTPLGIPAFAGGGMNAVTINFPGLPEITGLRASSGVVDELRHAAALAQVRSGGRKPSRFS